MSHIINSIPVQECFSALPGSDPRPLILPYGCEGSLIRMLMRFRSYIKSTCCTNILRMIQNIVGYLMRQETYHAVT